MTKERLYEICQAKRVICSVCESDMCEWCKIEHLVEAAIAKYESDDGDNEEYIRSNTNRDYSPSNPWDAPGMSVKDFI